MVGDHPLEDLVQAERRRVADEAAIFLRSGTRRGMSSKPVFVGLLVRNQLNLRVAARQLAHALGEIEDRDLLGVADVEDLADRARLAARGSMRPLTTSPTYVNDRVCVPSPYTVIGSPASAWRTKFGMTMP